MTVITDLAAMRTAETLPAGGVWILGRFDGVHRGHRSLLEEALRIASLSESRIPVGVWTLSGSDPEPGSRLTTEDEKLRLFRRFGAAYCVSDAFASIRGLSGETFFHERILGTLAPSALVCGSNFTFGRGASCGAKDLSRMAEEAGIPCSVLPLCLSEEDGTPVSSTEIRKLVQSGDMRGAARLLGHPYFVTGPVLHGHELGRTMGFPTLNLRLPPEKVAPPRGVYAALTHWKRGGSSRLSPGVSNLGFRPTVNGDVDDVTLETNLFDSPGDLYGSDVTVWLFDFLRPEERFASFENLREAIARDSREAERVLSSLRSLNEDEYCL